jgi:hypothetical protein
MTPNSASEIDVPVSFLTITTTKVEDEIALEVTTDNTDALPVISALARRGYPMTGEQPL